MIDDADKKKRKERDIRNVTMQKATINYKCNQRRPEEAGAAARERNTRPWPLSPSPFPFPMAAGGDAEA
jgi:hypothetical protein